MNDDGPTPPRSPAGGAQATPPSLKKKRTADEERERVRVAVRASRARVASSREVTPALLATAAAPGAGPSHPNSKACAGDSSPPQRVGDDDSAEGTQRPASADATRAPTEGLAGTTQDIPSNATDGLQLRPAHVAPASRAGGVCRRLKRGGAPVPIPPSEEEEGEAEGAVSDQQICRARTQEEIDGERKRRREYMAFRRGQAKAAKLDEEEGTEWRRAAAEIAAQRRKEEMEQRRCEREITRDAERKRQLEATRRDMRPALQATHEAREAQRWAGLTPTQRTLELCVREAALTPAEQQNLATVREEVSAGVKEIFARRELDEALRDVRITAASLQIERLTHDRFVEHDAGHRAHDWAADPDAQARIRAIIEDSLKRLEGAVSAAA